MRAPVFMSAVVAAATALLASAASIAADFTQLPAGNVEESPAWSRDGQFLAFSEEWSRITFPHCCEAGVRVAVYAWGQLHYLTADVNEAYALQPSFTPDGSVVLAYAHGSTPSDLGLLAVSGPGAQLTSHPAEDRDPAVSPDGTRVAFASDRSGNLDVWVVSIAGGEPVQLTTDTAGDRDPAWSPDGQLIAFTSDRNGNRDIWVMPAAGGEAVALTSEESQDSDPSWSPDGELLAFTSDRSGNQDIWVLRATNGAVSQLTNDPGDDFQPAWSPVGDRIAFTSTRGGLRHIWIASNLRTVNIESVTWSRFKVLFR